MSCECVRVRIVDDTEKQEEIQQADTSESQGRTTHDPTEVVTKEGFLGVLANEIKDVKVKETGTRDRKIQKVPEITLRKGDYKYFKPKELSIGPIHAADQNLFKKELKLKLTARFIEESRRTVDDLIQEFKLGFKDRIKSYFDEGVIKFDTEEELICLVVFDGCAMLAFIDSYVNQRLNMFNIRNGQAALIRHDLFMLENQIPSLVLKVLIGFRRSEWKTKYLINDFLRFIAMDSFFPKDSMEFYDMGHRLFGTHSTEDLDHVLGLHQRVLLNSSSHFTFGMTSILSGVVTDAVMNRSKKSYYVLQYLSIKQFFPNVQELETAGMEFKPTDSLTTISFHSGLFTTFPTLSSHISC